MTRGSARASQRVTTRALLLARTPYGEADLVLTFLTEARGSTSVLARAARKSQRRFGGALEPIHTLRIELDEREGRELGTLREATLDRPRLRIVQQLEKLEAAGRVLGWIRRGAPPHTPEPELWRLVEGWLDELDEAAESAEDIRRQLAAAGLGVLQSLGFRLELERCVVCGRPCPPERPGTLDARRGGLVCRSCGGARRTLSGPLRARMTRAAGGERDALWAADARVVLEIVDEALLAHAGM